MYIVKDNNISADDIQEIKEMLTKVIPSYSKTNTNDEKADFVQIAFLKKVLGTCLQIKNRSQMDMITEFLDIFAKHN